MAAEIQLRSPLSGLDALELSSVGPRSPRLARRIWGAAWPRVSAIGLGLVAWQLLAWSGWRPESLLPGPLPVLTRLFSDAGQAAFWQALSTTLLRGAGGFAMAILIGGLVGTAVARSRVLRVAVGSLVTGLQSMPSIAWFPLAILLFGLHETAIIFVVVMGAAPAIANGVISGVDQIPTVLLRYGRVAGARGLKLYGHIVWPASMPAVLAGLKQGWAFAWRSLMAGELLVTIGNRLSLGARLQFARAVSDPKGLLAAMLVILLVGMVVDALFGTAERSIARRRGLTR